MRIMIKRIGGQLLGANIKRIWLECGLTQEQTVAKMQVLGSPISRSTYSLIEMGRGNLFVTDLVGLKHRYSTCPTRNFSGIFPLCGNPPNGTYLKSSSFQP